MAILYSFRRCPYAIRARFALIYAGISFELREVKLSNKPAEMLAISPKGTVPVLQLADQRVLDESVDIVEYALSINDPDSYALNTDEEKQAYKNWVNEWQPQWVRAINHYKYHDRYPDLDRRDSWETLKGLLQQLDDALARHGGFVIRNTFSQADILLLPLIRQFAIIDQDFFRSHDWKALPAWLDNWMGSGIYREVMKKI